MKQIVLKTIEGTHDGKPLKINYKSQLVEIMGVPMNPNRGADVNEMRHSIRVLDALDALGQAPPPAPLHLYPNGEGGESVLELEDADFEHMKQCVMAYPWPLKNRLIVEFVNDVTKGE